MKALATFTLSTNYRKVNERLVRYPKKSSTAFVFRERRRWATVSYWENATNA
jgi:hypothetical protein